LVFIANKIFQQEAEENGYENTFEYIRKTPIRSVRELLPTYPYLRNKNSNELRIYPDSYPKNTFLENLNTPSNERKLDAISFTNIVGKEGNDTISTLRVDGVSIALMGDEEKAVKWGHGEPEGYDALLGGDRGLELGSGDGTVPIASARDIPADATIEIASSHGDLPTEAENIVYKTLTGSDTIRETLSKAQPSALLLVQVFSPVDIQIVSPSGKRVGKHFGTGGTYDEIQGAYYTGFDVQSEFVTIPDPEKGEYKILTEGTGTGSYRIEVAHIRSDASGDATESVVTFRGDTKPGATSSFSATITDTGVADASALKIAETAVPTDTPDVSSGGNSSHDKKKASKKPIITTVTANEGRPMLATNLFPYLDMEAAPASKLDASVNEKGESVSEVAGAASESGNHLWAILFAALALFAVIGFTKIAWNSLEGNA
jgi:hypothetical protein